MASSSKSMFSAAEDVPHLSGDLLRQQALEVELDAARQHRHRQLLRIGRRQQELHVRRRLFQRLQQRVERVLRQHVHFVDQIDLEAAARRRVLRVLDQLAHVVDAGVAGRVDLEQVDEAAGVDLGAYRTLAAGFRRLAAFAVQRLGEDARDRGLADAARAGEQKRVMHAPGIERIGERAHDVFLPDQFGKLARTPFAREDLIRHAILPWGEHAIVPRRQGEREPVTQACVKPIAERVAAPPATSRHPNHSLPLLPSGPGGVCELSSRGDRRGHHRRKR